MRKQIWRKLMAGILASVMMIASVPETVYAVEQAGGTEQENEENDVKDESNVDVGNDEIEKDDVNGEEISDQNHVSGEENGSETPGGQNTETGDTLGGETEKIGGEEQEPEFSEEEEGILTEKEVPAESEVVEAGEEIALYAARSFVPRTSDPGNNSYYTSGNPYIGPCNCTYYAWGRAHELLGYRPHTWTGNAGNWWYNNDGYERGGTPRLGAIMCWGSADNNEYGHVAVVEAIHGNGTIDYSEASYYPAYSFKYQNNRNINSLSSSYGTFQGYIYLPGIPSEAPPQPEIGSDMPAPFTRNISDGDYHIVTALDDSMCLDIAGASQGNGANTQIWHGTEDELQVFTVTWLGADKGYKIIHRNSGKSLDVYLGETKRGANVCHWSAVMAEAQITFILSGMVPIQEQARPAAVIMRGLTDLVLRSFPHGRQ